jgi:hypothetical protein
MMPDLLARFALSSSHLLTAEKLIARQKRLIKKLADAGQDVRAAWGLLVLFEDIQLQMTKHHRSIMRDVEARNDLRRGHESAPAGEPGR